jgi:hypothetical protein
LLYVSRWGVDYSHAIVVAGLAAASVSAKNPVEKAKTLQMAEDTSRTLKVGIWDDLCAPRPPAPSGEVVAAPQPSVPSREVEPDTPVGPPPSPAPAPSRTASPRSPSPPPESPREPASGCHPSYEPCVPVSPTDLDCRDIGHRVKVVGPDEYRLDGDDDDGKGCESFPPK